MITKDLFHVLLFPILATPLSSQNPPAGDSFRVCKNITADHRDRWRQWVPCKQNYSGYAKEGIESDGQEYRRLWTSWVVIQRPNCDHGVFTELLPSVVGHLVALN